MKIAFISNFINHHQVYVADELYKLVGDGYKFIETEPMPEEFIKNGYPDYSERPYVVKAYSTPSLMEYAKKFAYNADVVVIGSAPEELVIQRIHDNKLTFRYNERWFKSKPWYLTGLKGWIHLYKNHIRYRNKPVYMLCASAFTSKDVTTVGAYKNKCYKWGYFTKVEQYDIEELNQKLKLEHDTVRIMWCARFIKLKHPELPIQLASKLKKLGYSFILDMFGDGEELEHMKELAKHMDVCDCVEFKGVAPNDKILNEMKKHDIFLFTSDRNEGWGAVLNEAMSCGCAVVGSDKIGSVPFLINDGINGLIFQSENLKSLLDKVLLLLNNPSLIKNISLEAYKTMRDIWSPQNAASQFYTLIISLSSGKEFNIASGPCSKA